MTIKKMLQSFLIYIFFYAGINIYIMNLKLSAIPFTIISIINMLIINGLLIKINNINIKEKIKDFKENKKDYLKLIFKTLLIGLIFIIITNLIISHFNELPQNELTLRKEIKLYPIYYILNILILGPIMEEILFRYTFTIIKNKYIYLIVTTLFFAFLHMQKIPEDLIYLITYSLMSFTFTYPFYKTNNIINSIITHSAYNLISLILILF